MDPAATATLRVIRWMNDKVLDPRNFYQDCKKYGINPRRTTQDLVEMELFICNKNLAELQLNAREIRCVHLKNHPKLVKEKEDDDAVKAIVSILHQETKHK